MLSTRLQPRALMRTHKQSIRKDTSTRQTLRKPAKLCIHTTHPKISPIKQTCKTVRQNTYIRPHKHPISSRVSFYQRTNKQTPTRSTQKLYRYKYINHAVFTAVRTVSYYASQNPRSQSDRNDVSREVLTGFPS